MRIVFLTDLHIGTEQQKPLQVDMRRNLLDALAFLPEIKPDYLVIGGDICYQTGDRSIYRWVRPHLDVLPFPYYLIPGNHDDSIQLAEEFGLVADLHGDELFFTRILSGYPVIFLDTARGACSDSQWTWLREQLGSITSPILVFMHHPPLKGGIQHMDINYPFRQSEQFLSLVESLSVPVTVVCGHYHGERLVQRGNLNVLITPSLFFQMKHDPIECVIDHYRIGIREINWTEQGLTSTIYYLEGNRTT